MSQKWFRRVFSFHRSASKFLVTVCDRQIKWSSFHGFVNFIWPLLALRGINPRNPYSIVILLPILHDFSHQCRFFGCPYGAGKRPSSDRVKGVWPVNHCGLGSFAASLVHLLPKTLNATFGRHFRWPFGRVSTEYDDPFPSLAVRRVPEASSLLYSFDIMKVRCTVLHVPCIQLAIMREPMFYVLLNFSLYNR